MDNIQPTPKLLAFIGLGLLIFSLLSAILSALIERTFMLDVWFGLASVFSGIGSIMVFGGALIWWIDEADKA